MTKVTLANLPDEIRKNRLKNLAINIVKYQNFSTNSIVSKIDNAGYPETTLRFYIDKGIAYIKNGSACRQLGSFTQYLDECIEQYIQPLTPKETERRRQVFRKSKCSATPNSNPVQRVLNKIAKEAKPYSFAVQMEHNIRLYDSIEEAKAFKDGLSFMGNISAKIIKVVCEEI